MEQKGRLGPGWASGSSKGFKIHVTVVQLEVGHEAHRGGTSQTISCSLLAWLALEWAVCIQAQCCELMQRRAVMPYKYCFAADAGS